MSGCRGIMDSLPEEIIAAIVAIMIESLTSPRDASRYASVSKSFQSDADTDGVWRRFLPPNIQEIIARHSNCAPRCGACAGCLEIERLNSLSNKQLFLRLADQPLLIDDGSKSFELDKRSGKIICKIAARGLIIYFGDDAQYWKWTDEQEKRFQEVAYLNFVWTLKIQGNIKMSSLSPNTTYVAYFVFKMEDINYGFDRPLEASVRNGGMNKTRKVAMFTQEEELKRGYVIHPVEGRPEQRPDGWFELEIGEFKIGEFVINGEQDGDVQMALSNINDNYTKRGLFVWRFEIRPKAVQP